MLDQPEKKRYPDFSKRVRLLGVALFIALCVLAGRLWQLQIIEGEHYSRQAESNRLRPQVLEAPRGMIYGRDSSIVLADNRAATDLMFISAEAEDPEAVAERLAELIDIDPKAFLEKVEEHQRQPYTQIPVKRDISRTALTRVEEHSYALPGVFTVVRPQRRYLYGSTAGQLLGYLGEIGPEELEESQPAYKMGDRIGRAGVERYYEDRLHGTDGQLLMNVYASGVPQVRTDAYGRPYIETDSFGRRLRQETQYPPESGEALHLTLDIKLQAFAEGLLEGEQGAIVVLNAETGEVLAMASQPTYDPSVFVRHGEDEARKEALSDPDEPMKNRGYQDTYPPGSIFKTAMAAAALEEGVLDRETQYFCPGHFQINNRGRRWHCWRRSGHGHVRLDEALALSCDVYFYNLGLELGVDRIHEWMTRFGLGKSTGIDLPREHTGLMPSREWKRETRQPHYPNEPWEWNWYDGNTLNLSIGQGASTVTPLQAAVMTAAFVNGGRRVYPFINQEHGPARVSEPFLQAETVEAVWNGMRMCVEKEDYPSGTGNRAKVDGVAIGGKTGTSQNVGLNHLEQYGDNVEDIPYEMRHHAWFVAGVPDEDPPIALSVLVEHGHSGSRAAAPLAREIIDYFYTYRAPSESLLAAKGEAEEQ
ncbi:MAG: penicillin-binding protein 2 [Candidatus Hydrogenedentota bacterium]